MKSEKEIFIYFIKGLCLYLIWYFVYDLWLKPAGNLDAWLNNSVAISAYKIVNLLGYDTCIEGTNVCVNTVSTVRVGSGCNGLEIYAIFAGFILLFDGKWLAKLIYIVVGIFFIFFCNLIRVSMLAIDHYKNLELFNFNHKYTYVFVIYSIVFGLWVLWISKFSKKQANYVH